MPGRRLALLLIGVGLAFQSWLWLGPGILASKSSDILAEHAGIATVLRQSVLEEGRLPVWNPSMNAGAPALANPQALSFFPFDLLHLILPLDRAINGIVVAATLVAGLSMFLLCRVWLRHPVSAFVCGVAYMLSWRFLAMLHAGWLPKLGLYALSPLLLWGILRLLRADARGIVIFAGICGLGLVQGDLQQLYYTGLAQLLLALLVLRRLPTKAAWPFAGRLVLGGLLGLFLAAPVLLPRLEFAALSTRTESSYAFFLYRAPELARLATLLDPLDQGGEAKEYWETNFYLGIGLLPLVGLALLCNRRSAWPWALAVVGIVGLCFDTPILRALYEVFPGFSLFRIPSRLLMLGQLCWTVLAGLGLDVLLGPHPDRRRRLLVGLLALLPIAEGAWRMGGRLQTIPLEEAFPGAAFHPSLQRQPAGSRVAAIGRAAVPYGQAAVFGIDLVNGYASLNLKHFVDTFFLMKLGDPRKIPPGPKVWTDLEQVAREDLLAAMDVGHIVANADLGLESMGYRKLGPPAEATVFQMYRGWLPEKVFVWEATQPLGGAYFASSVHRVADESASWEALQKSRSPLQAFVLDYEGQPGLYPGSATARLTRRGLQELEYEVEHEEAGGRFLILSQVWYPGWTATLEDGQPLKLYRVNHAWMGTLVPPGQHRLSLRSGSPRFWLGLGLAVLGILGLGAIEVAGRRFNRRG